MSADFKRPNNGPTDESCVLRLKHLLRKMDLPQSQER